MLVCGWWGWYSGFQVTGMIKGFFWGGGAVKVLQVPFFSVVCFNVCIKLSGNVRGLEIQLGNCLRLHFGPGFFLGFSVLPPFDHHCHLKSRVPIIIITLTSKQGYF